MPTHWAAVASAVHGLLVAADGFRPADTDEADEPGTPVYFGYAVDDAQAPLLVVVAASADLDGTGPAGTLVQVPGPIGDTLQLYDETGEINCLAVAQSGDMNAATVLADCSGLVDQVHALLRATPTANLGTALITVRFMQAAPTLIPTRRGAVCEIPFIVTYTARWRTA